jgi:YD repeat-containing protein
MRETRTYYDGSTTLGAVTNGDATEVDQAKGYSGSTEQFTKTTNSYDAYGRPTGTTAYDPGLASGNRTTTTAYTPAGTGALTQTVVTNAKNQTTTTLLDPSRGYTTKITDTAGRITTATHDAMGRVTAVWKPGQVQGTNNATVTYAYLLGPTAPLAVTTKTLVDAGNGSTPGYVTSISIYDAFGGLRQTQSDAVGGGGRVVADTFPDSHGWTVKSNTRWYTSGTPTTSLITTTDGSIADRKITIYDGTGRPTQVNDYNGTTQTSTSKTIYGGDRTTTIPPTGGITATSIVDGEGRQVELDQYKTAPTVTGNVVANGTYDKETFTLDALGQQIGRTTGGTDTTAANATWSTTFDLLGRPTTHVDPDSGTTTTSYFDTGEVATSTDATGRVLAYDYDVLGRKIGKYSGSLTGTKLDAWTYDTASNGVGQVASTVAYTGGYSYTETSLGYDSNGNSLGSTLTSTDPALSLMSSYPTKQTWTTTHELHSQNLASSSPSQFVGAVAEQLTYWYDSNGDPTGLTGLNSYVSGAVYSAYGELTQYTLGISTSTAQLTYSRDAQTRRVTDINFSGQTAYPQLEDAAYTYDLAGNPTKVTDVQGSTGAPTETQCYTYNGLDQLTQAWSATDSCATNPTTAASNAKVGGPEPYWTTWGYDDSGNRSTQTQHAVTGGVSTDTTTNYATADPNHVHALSGTTTTGGTTASNNYTYAADGAMKTSTVAGATNTFNYGPDGQLANIATNAGTSSYVRDADGNILTTTAPDGTTTLYLPGQEIQIATGRSPPTGTTPSAGSPSPLESIPTTRST